MHKIAVASAALCLSASALWAEQWECTMTRECLDEEPCQDTDYDVTIGAVNNGAYVMSTISGERAFVEAVRLKDDDPRAFVSLSQNLSVELISIYADGAAHYSVHSPDYAVRYSGMCEERS